MKTEQTLSVVKPDAVRKNLVGSIYQRFEENGLRIASAYMTCLSPRQAAEFYAIHKDRPFFSELIAFMTSGPVFVQVLEGANAIQKNRSIMGDTDPSKADPGTIRHDFCQSISENAVHGSDSKENAIREINFFFAGKDIYDSPA